MNYYLDTLLSPSPSSSIHLQKEVSLKKAIVKTQEGSQEKKSLIRTIQVNMVPNPSEM